MVCVSDSVCMGLGSAPENVPLLVVSLDASTVAGKRLAQLGLLPESRLRVAQVAPLGDPIAIEFHGAHISLRRAEAECVRVRLLV